MAPDRSERRLTWSLGITLLAYYLLTLGGHQYSSDGIVIFQSAKALVFQHSFVLDPPVRWQGEVTVSRWGIGMTLAYVPLLLLWYPLFARFPVLKAIPYDPSHHASPALYANVPYLLCSGLNPLLTAASACLVFRIGRALGLAPGWAVSAALAYGVASPAAAYARYDFPQPLATLALTAAVWGLLRPDAPATLRPLLWAGASLGFGILTRTELLAVLPWVVGWVGVRSRRAGLGVRAALLRPAAIVAPVGVALAGQLWINWLKFGGPTETGYPLPTWPTGGFRLETLEGIVGLLASPGRGLLFFFPLAWLALPGLSRLARTTAGAASLFAGVIGILMLVYGFSSVFWAPRDAPPEWWAGTSWGPRFLVPLLPLLALAAAVWAGRPVDGDRPRRRAAFLALGGLGIVVSWNGILFDFVEYYRWIHGPLGFPWTGLTHFQPAASPLISGWGLPARAWDLFWLLDPDLVRPLRELQRQAASQLGLDLAGALRPWALLIPLLFLGCLAWAASGVRAGLSRR